MLKRISPAESAAPAMQLRVVLLTMDAHLSTATERARLQLARSYPGLELTIHTAAEYSTNQTALIQCIHDIELADIVIVAMLFMEEHFQPVLPALKARREHCDAMICAMSAPDVMKLTRMGRFTMDGNMSGPMALLKRLRGKPAAGGSAPPSGSGGERQLQMLRRLPKLLRFIPGTAQDMRVYFLTLQYWLAGSEENITNMVLSLAQRYARGGRDTVVAAAKPAAPAEYPEVGVYHPNMKPRLSERLQDLPQPKDAIGTVGLLLMRPYLLSGNAAHYDFVIDSLTKAGMRVIPAFATGLDSRPAIEKFFWQDGKRQVDAVISLTGFSLVGGPAYNDARAAEETLARLNVPYLAVTPLEFQTLEQWGLSEQGLSPVESTMMVAIPELDGATGSIVFAGRSTEAPSSAMHDMHPEKERVQMLAARVRKLIELQKVDRSKRKLAVVLFNFPPNAGSVGTAAFLGVFESLYNTLEKLRDEGYRVELPGSVDALRSQLLEGNTQHYGTSANVCASVSGAEHVKRQRWLREIEAQWGPTPGKIQTDGSSILILGAQFGNVFVGLQPAFGYEGDPMRLLFEKGFAPTHAFAAFYRWIRDEFKAHAVLHFGTHGALEFLPGKQTGLSSECWPDRMIGDLPNIYLYASNNPSEGAIAKRRSAATLISYLTPAVAEAGLYRDLVDLKSSIDRWRNLPPGAQIERDNLIEFIRTQAGELELLDAKSFDTRLESSADSISRLAESVREIEYSWIPDGMHVVGKVSSREQRSEVLHKIALTSHEIDLPRAIVDKLTDGESTVKILEALRAMGIENSPAAPLAAPLVTPPACLIGRQRFRDPLPEGSA